MNQPNLLNPPELIPVEKWGEVVRANDQGGAATHGILAADAITFTVFGKAEPAGSKTSQVIYRNGQPVTKNGRVITATRDANPKSADWKLQVAAAARAAYTGPLLTGPLSFTLTAYRIRGAGHFSKTTGAMNKNGRETPYPISKPDLLKLTRGIEDACTGIVWRDDAQIVDEHLFKRWGEPARIEVKIERMQ